MYKEMYKGMYKGMYKALRAHMCHGASRTCRSSLAHAPAVAVMEWKKVELLPSTIALGG